MKTFTLIAVVVFSMVAAAQLLRVVMGWEVVIAGLVIPPWVSIVACVFAALLAVMVWREHHAAR